MVVQLYRDAFLEYLGAIPLPKITVGGTLYPLHGRYVFWKPDGAGLYAIVQADSKTLLAGGTGIIQASASDAKQVTVQTVVKNASQGQTRIASGEVISIYGSGVGPKVGVGLVLDPLTNKVKTNLAGTEVIRGRYTCPGALRLRHAGQVRLVEA